jgi:hypothetical protein
MLEIIRTELNDFSTALVEGTENGVYDNSDIVRKINSAQRYMFGLLLARMPELFLTSSTVTGSSGVYAIPSDMHRLVNITNSNGDRINPISIQEKHLGTSTGSDYSYYRSGNTIIRDSGSSDSLTFNYYKAPKELTQGKSTGGSATSITLATTASKVADYYNNVVIENVTDDWSDTITDYSTARVATITQRGSLGKYYGTVSELPEPFHHLITKKAILELKNYVSSPQRAGTPEIADFRDDLIETLRSFAGSRNDVSMSELFYDFRPYV